MLRTSFHGGFTPTTVPGRVKPSGAGDYIFAQYLHILNLKAGLELWVDSDCRREENYQRSVSQFWARDPDHSCRAYMEQHGAELSSEEASCGILSQYISFISTPLFIAVSQADFLPPGREEIQYSRQSGERKTKPLVEGI